MEFWLYGKKVEMESGKEKVIDEEICLPVLPSEYKIKKGNNNSTIAVADIGEISLIGKSKLAEISISSFFPAQQYNFSRPDAKQPYEYVEMIEGWMASGHPVRFIITGKDVNGLFTIEEFERGEQDGTGDVYFTLSLKEYRVIEEKIL